MLSLGIYGVGKAAIHPPALAVLSHTPDGATQTIAWVGKGIVYDTGGLSMKGKVRCRTRAGGTWQGKGGPFSGVRGKSKLLGHPGGRPWGPIPSKGQTVRACSESGHRKSGEEEEKVLG